MSSAAARETSTAQEFDECVSRWHDQAVAAGDERILARTMDGDLYSYRADEITLYRQGNSSAVAPIWFMTTFSVMWVGIALAVTVMAVVSSGGDGQWARMVLPVIVGLFAWLHVVWARQDWHADSRRQERGIPEPKAGTRPVQIDVQWPPPRMRRRKPHSARSVRPR